MCRLGANLAKVHQVGDHHGGEEAEGDDELLRLADDIKGRFLEAGDLGVKTGKGFYKYESGSRAPIPDPEVELREGKRGEPEPLPEDVQRDLRKIVEREQERIGGQGAAKR